VIVRFWVIHHLAFRLIARYDLRLIWLNLLLLMFLAFLPFPRAVLGFSASGLQIRLQIGAWACAFLVLLSSDQGGGVNGESATCCAVGLDLRLDQPVEWWRMRLSRMVMNHVLAR
jgi:uncharacterized membrane protein